MTNKYGQGTAMYDMATTLIDERMADDLVDPLNPLVADLLALSIGLLMAFGSVAYDDARAIVSKTLATLATDRRASDQMDAQ